jgi:integrase
LSAFSVFGQNLFAQHWPLSLMKYHLVSFLRIGYINPITDFLSAMSTSILFFFLIAYPMNASTLRSLFTRARDIAIKAYPELANGIKEFQFRDLQAKAGTDKEEIDGISAAQDQQGHATATMTEHYVRHCSGRLVKPTK